MRNIFERAGALLSVGRLGIFEKIQNTLNFSEIVIGQYKKFLLNI